MRPSREFLDDVRAQSLYDAVFWLELALYALALVLATRLLSR